MAVPYLPWPVDNPGDVTLYARMGLSALVAIGLSLLMGFAGQVSLGQGAFFALGAYTAGLLSIPATALAGLDVGLDPLLSLLIAPVLTAGVAAVVGVPLLRLRGHYLAFATLALHLILLAVIFGEEALTGGQTGLIGIPALEVGGRAINGALHAAVVWACVLVAFIVAQNLVTSRAGRGLQAIAASESSAAASGVNVTSYKLRLFVLAAGFAGLAGGLYTYLLLYLSPDAFGLIISIEFVVMVAVGGLGSVSGAVLGAIGVSLLQEYLTKLGTRQELLGFDLPVQAPTVFRIGVYGAIFVLVMLFFPRGLLPAFTGAIRRRR